MIFPLEIVDRDLVHVGYIDSDASTTSNADLILFLGRCTVRRPAYNKVTQDNFFYTTAQAENLKHVALECFARPRVLQIVRECLSDDRVRKLQMFFTKAMVPSFTTKACFW